MEANRLEEELSREEELLLRRHTEIAMKFMAIPLVLGFSAIDYFYAPEHFFTFLIGRLIVIPVSMLCIALFRIPHLADGMPAIPAHLFCLYLGIFNAFMITKTGFEESLYINGLNLIALGSLGLLPYSNASLFISLGVIYGPLAVVLAFQPKVNPYYVLPMLAFCTGTSFMAGLISVMGRRLRENEYLSKMALEKEIRSRNTEIDQRTNESYYLRRISGQFTPNVIEHVKNGTVSLDKPIRRNITAIFIDVADSTKKANSLDRSDYLDALMGFYSIVIKILRDHELTVGAFLGDGLIAFTNAPLEQSQHRLKAVKACCDILRMLEGWSEFFEDRWRGKFNIRIGMHAGFADVGFFPSQDYGLYTPIGDTVNLACRLAAEGHVNSITLSKALLTKVAQNLQGMEAKVVQQTQNIKGFENQLISICSLYLTQTESSVVRKICPLCGGNLVLKNDLGEVLLFGCHKCSFQNVVRKIPDYSAPKRA